MRLVLRHYHAFMDYNRADFLKTMIGKRIAHYEILSELGAGGMGEVYLAQDTRLSRHVALKILPDIFANDDERVARFEREARVLASLNHPNIAVLHGMERADGKHFL